MVAPPRFEEEVTSPAPPGDLDALRLRKCRLREVMRAKRAGLAPDELRRRSVRLAERFMEVIADLPPGPVAAFWSLPEEIETLPLIERLWEKGRQVLLPRQAGKGLPLDLHLWRKGDPLDRGPFGVREPSASSPRLVPVALAVPLLAFDSAGHRLGYGAGFYDRTLAQLGAGGSPPLAIGYALDLQGIEAVPVDDHDMRLPLIVTETRTLVTGAPGGI